MFIFVYIDHQQAQCFLGPFFCIIATKKMATLTISTVSKDAE